MTPGLEDYLAELPHFRHRLDQPQPGHAGVRRVLLIGEAQSYGAQQPSPTVFNHHPRAGIGPLRESILQRYELTACAKLPLGWKLGDTLQAWVDSAKDKNPACVRSLPQNPGRIVVYEVVVARLAGARATCRRLYVRADTKVRLSFLF